MKTNKSKGSSKMVKSVKKHTSAKTVSKVVKAKKTAVKKPIKVTKPTKVIKPVKTTKPIKITKPVKVVAAVSKTQHKPEHKEVKKPLPIKAVKIDIPFSIGDYAVYPAHGVGKVEAVEEKHIMGEKIEFLVMSILDTGMNVFIPTKNIASIGLRQVVKSSKVKDVYDVLKQKKRSVTGATWNRRYREYMEKIKSGSVFEIAEVLRDLMVLKTEKDLSFGERKMLDTARTLLVKELALAKGINEKKVEAEILKIFSEV